MKSTVKSTIMSWKVVYLTELIKFLSRFDGIQDEYED